MKKMLLLPLVFLMLCGCSQRAQTTPILNDISFTAQINYGSDKYAGDVTIADNTLTITVTEPEQIKDLILTINNSGIKAELKGISYTPNLNTLPQGAVGQILFNVLNDIKGKTVESCDQNCKINGRVDGYKYTITISPSGLPIDLEIPELNLKIKFNNVTVIKNE